MLMSWQCTIGRGTSKTVDVEEDEQDRSQRLNFLGAPLLTRHLAFAALKETYASDPQVLQDALWHIASDLKECMLTGIKVRYEGQAFVLRLAPVCTKGDWPWLIEAGLLTRHFRRAAKKSESKTPAAGICHLCMAGYGDIPCSDASHGAKWQSTMTSAAAAYAWDEESALTQLLPSHPLKQPQLYRPDLFHNWHLGIGQTFLASTLVLVANLCSGATIPARFAELTSLWRKFCADRSLGWIFPSSIAWRIDLWNLLT